MDRRRTYGTYRYDPTVKIPIRTVRHWQLNASRATAVGTNEDHAVHIDMLNQNHDFAENINSNHIDHSSSESTNDIEENSTESDDFSVGDSCYDYSSTESTNDIQENDTESDDFSVGDSCSFISSSDDMESDSEIQLVRTHLPLYKGSRMKVGEFATNFNSVAVKNKLSQTAKQDFLNLFRAVVPEDECLLPPSLFKLNSVSEQKLSLSTIRRHYYCSQCLQYIGVIETLEELITCTNITADNQLCGSIVDKKSPYFFAVDLEAQLRYLFECEDLGSKLISVPEPNATFISDIQDGSEYIRVNQLRNNRARYDITLIFNTDGLQLSNSSRLHVWPILFTIAELPEYLRESFIMTAGLWCDRIRKPAINTFFVPLVDQLKSAFNDGIKWTDPNTNQIHISRVVAPLFIADAPARAMLQNINSYNGRFGCNLCEMQTKLCAPIDGKRNVRAYIYDSREAMRLRTSIRMNYAARGVKGPSVLSEIPLLDLSTCVLPEFMHAVLLGVVKRVTLLWLEKQEIRMKRFLPQMDHFLLSVKPPNISQFHRLPRSLIQVKQWKASELLNWLLVYSIPALHEILPDRYFQHWMLLSIGIFLLLKRTISEEDVTKAEIVLKRFVGQFESLYTDRECSYNVHQLLHMTLMVKRWGPLWATSAFPFENFNGIIANSVHGTKNQGAELMNILSKVVLLNRTHQRTSAEDAALNQIKELAAFDNEVLSSHGYNVEEVEIFSRARIQNKVFTSESYKTTKYNSYTICMCVNAADGSKTQLYGSIKFFFGKKENFHVLLKNFIIRRGTGSMFRNIPTQKNVEHILAVEESGLAIVHTSKIAWIRYVVKIGNYVCELPHYFNKVL